MNLISREAAIEAVKIPDDGCSNPSERHGIIFARVEARRAIRNLPSVSAVPLDKLCEWLGALLDTPCMIADGLCDRNCQGYKPTDAECWREVITKWKEEQDAVDRR